MTNRKLSGTANDGTRALNADVLPESNLGEPKKAFADTFSAETVVMDAFFPSTLSESAGASGLLPCPFCGSQPVTERTGFSGRAMYVYCNAADIGCPRPKAVGESEDAAIANWNTRAAPVQAEPVAWLRDAQPDHEDEALVVCNKIDPRAFAVYASPPTPVSGEADAEAIDIAIYELEVAAASYQASPWPDNDRKLYADVRAARAKLRALYATPVSAGLDDMGKQNGSEEIPTRKQSS